MRITQGTFSYLPDFGAEEIAEQVRYALAQGWPVSIEFTDDPHPRNVYWEMWGLPMFDSLDENAVLSEIEACRAEHRNEYVKVSAYDRRLGRQTTALSFIVNRPPSEPGFTLERTELSDRRIAYTTRAYAAADPHGERYRAR